MVPPPLSNSLLTEGTMPLPQWGGGLSPIYSLRGVWGVKYLKEHLYSPSGALLEPAGPRMGNNVGLPLPLLHQLESMVRVQ